MTVFPDDTVMQASLSSVSLIAYLLRFEAAHNGDAGRKLVERCSQTSALHILAVKNVDALMLTLKLMVPRNPESRDRFIDVPALAAVRRWPCQSST